MIWGGEGIFAGCRRSEESKFSIGTPYLKTHGRLRQKRSLKRGYTAKVRPSRDLKLKQNRAQDEERTSTPIGSAKRGTTELQLKKKWGDIDGLGLKEISTKMRYERDKRDGVKEKKLGQRSSVLT